MAVHALLPDLEEIAIYEVTPWVLLVGRDWWGLQTLRRHLESSACAVEVASTAEEALFCLAVMTPALMIIEQAPASPGAGDFLDRARLIGINSAGDRDVVREELAKYRQRDRGQLLGEA
jgi:hypothetical protein